MATPTLADRVWETSTTTGTGDFTLAGAETGYRTFNAGVGTGVDVHYTIHNEGSPAEFESGIGQLSTSTNLQRNTVVESSNAGSLVNFSAGTKNVFLVPLAKKVAVLDENDELKLAWIPTLTIAEGAVGFTTYAQGDVLYASAADTLAKLAAGTNGQVLTLASGVPSWADAAGGAMVLLATASASNDATVDFTAGIDATYDEYILVLLNVVPATDAVRPWFRTTTDGGANWDAGASDYQTVVSGGSRTGVAQIDFTSANVGSGADEMGVSARIHIVRPSVAAPVQIHGRGMYISTGGSFDVEDFTFAANRNTAADVDGIRFLFSSGNVESGEFKLYGVVKS